MQTPFEASRQRNKNLCRTSILPNVLKAYLNVTQDDKSNAFAVAISHLAVNLLTIEFTLLMMLALHYSAGTSAISHASAWVWSSH